MGGEDRDDLQQRRTRHGVRLGLPSHSLWELARARGVAPDYIAWWPAVADDDQGHAVAAARAGAVALVDAHGGRAWWSASAACWRSASARPAWPPARRPCAWCGRRRRWWRRGACRHLLLSHRRAAQPLRAGQRPDPHPAERVGAARLALVRALAVDGGDRHARSTRRNGAVLPSLPGMRNARRDSPASRHWRPPWR